MTIEVKFDKPLTGRLAAMFVEAFQEEMQKKPWRERALAVAGASITAIAASSAEGEIDNIAITLDFDRNVKPELAEQFFQALKGELENRWGMLTAKVIEVFGP